MGSGDPHVMAWDSATGAVQRDMPLGQQGQIRMALSRDGKWMATFGIRKGSVKIWDTTHWTVFRQFDTPGMVNNVLFTPDNRYVSWALQEWQRTADNRLNWHSRLTILNQATGETTESRVDAGRTFLYACSPDSRHILSETVDDRWKQRTVDILDAQTGAKTATVQLPDNKQDMHENISRLWFGEDSETVYGLYPTGYTENQASGYLVTWDAKTGEVTRKMKRSGMSLSYLNPVDNDAKYTSDYDRGILQLWDLQQIVDRETPRPLAGLRWFDHGKWLITTPDGYYDCSPDLVKDLVWKFNGTISPYQQYEKQYHRPELVRKALAR
jgi:hypothetical protein